MTTWFSNLVSNNHWHCVRFVFAVSVLLARYFVSQSKLEDISARLLEQPKLTIKYNMISVINYVLLYPMTFNKYLYLKCRYFCTQILHIIHQIMKRFVVYESVSREVALPSPFQLD